MKFCEVCVVRDSEEYWSEAEHTIKCADGKSYDLCEDCMDWLAGGNGVPGKDLNKIFDSDSVWYFVSGSIEIEEEW